MWHTGERAHKCSVCHKAFFQVIFLIRLLSENERLCSPLWFVHRIIYKLRRGILRNIWWSTRTNVHLGAHSAKKHLFLNLIWIAIWKHTPNRMMNAETRNKTWQIVPQLVGSWIKWRPSKRRRRTKHRSQFFNPLNFDVDLYISGVP